MAAKKRAARKKPSKEDVYLIPEEDEAPPLPLTIETDITLDSIEYKTDEENPEAEPKYCITFHLDLPEHIAQQLFANHIQEGRSTVEFHPANPELRRRGMLVRR